MPGGPRSVAESGLPSREVTAPCRVSSLETLAPSLLRRSPHALYPSRGWATGSSRSRPPRNEKPFLGILSWASAPLQRQPKHRAAALSRRLPDGPTYDPCRTPTSSASLEVSTPSASLQLRAAAFVGRKCLFDRLRLQVLATSWRLHPPRACRPCFMPDPLLGSPSRAFFLPRSRTLFPAPFPSWRLVRLQGFAPRESPPSEPVV